MREVVRAMCAVAAAYVAMGLVAAAGLLLLGADGAGRLIIATVTMAGGGGIDATGELPQAQARRLAASLHGGIGIMPLGVSLAGALVLVIALRRGRDADRGRSGPFTARGTRYAGRAARCGCPPRSSGCCSS